ncbi:hypothetical protein H8356DRAFT_1336252 [Neocallimastix lanati (nom. inval.)]|nr:hypothetical protein H8356DRAFT_1336252 [Neocallimastix sp. JGI-2020a]
MKFNTSYFRNFDNIYDSAALHCVCASLHYEWDCIITLVKILLPPNINKNSQNNQGITPLAMTLTCFNATIKNELPLRITYLLIKHQAENNVLDTIKRNTVLTIIFKCYHSYNIIKILIEKGKANVNTINWEEELAMSLVCHSNNIEQY